jgi:hypothetical protein
MLRRTRSAAAAFWLSAAALSTVLLCVDTRADEKPPEKATPGAVEIRFADDSTLKMSLREESIEVVTPYGKLRVPFADVKQIDFATRIAPEVARRIDRLITDLASTDEKVREQAASDLLAQRDRAYPALVEAAKSTDADVKQRAEQILDRLREATPEDQPLFRKFDTVHTTEMKITGRIEGATWKAKTSQFGDVEIKLADLRGMRLPGAEEKTEVLNVMPDPIHLENFKGQTGKRFAFTVTGVAGNGLYGTDIYTSDSILANCAVHAGVLKPGQTGVVKVEIVVPPGAFVASTRNGVTSNAYGAYNGAFKVLK